jgi:hypothetical protein
MLRLDPLLSSPQYAARNVWFISQRPVVSSSHFFSPSSCQHLSVQHHHTMHARPTTTTLLLLVVAAVLFAVAVVTSAQSTAPMPPPFTRVLSVQSPPLHGNDVVILQNLIMRSPCVTLANATGSYDTPTANAVTSFQQCNNLLGVKAGVFDSITANALLNLNSCDGIIDSGVAVGPLGYKYKACIHSTPLQYWKR